MSEQNKAAIRKIYEVFSGGDPSVINQIVAAGAVDHEGMPGIDTSGPEGMKRLIAVFRSAFPDLKMSAEDMIADGDKVAARVTMRGTHKGEFMGVPATGKWVEVSGIDIVRFEGGKAVEHWGITDTMSMMQQLGALPS